MQDMIVATQISREFHRADGQLVQALAEVSFAIARGQFVCIVGPSGCGKSTLLQMIAGLLLPSSGTMAVNGAPVTGPGPDRGMVFQKDSVFPWLRVIRNVEYGLKCRGVDKAERQRIASFYLDRVGLSPVARAWMMPDTRPRAPKSGPTLMPTLGCGGISTKPSSVTIGSTRPAQVS